MHLLSSVVKSSGECIVSMVSECSMNSPISLSNLSKDSGTELMVDWEREEKCEEKCEEKKKRVR